MGTQCQIISRIHTWEIPDLAQRREAARGILQELEMMPTPPGSREEREFYGSELWVYVFCQFTDGLSAADLKLWESLPKSIPEGDLEHHRIQRAFDVLLSRQFHIWGWKLLMSECALARLAQWEVHDTSLVESLCDNLVRRAKHLQRETGGHFPVSGEDIRRTEALLLPELRTLFPKVRTHFGKQRRERTNSELFEFIKKEISVRQADYRNLCSNMSALGGFINSPSRDSSFASRVRSGTIRPERFLHMLLEDTTGYRWGHLKNLKANPTA